MTYGYSDVEKETNKGIDRGLRNSHAQWRGKTLSNLERFCEKNPKFTMNDFRDYNKAHNKFKTHDNRAMGGIIKTARTEKWIRKTGNSIVSKVGHKSPLQIWKSLIVKE